MGSDDLFKKSKAKRIKSKTTRSIKTKDSIKRILIVSEGIKTEPIYFQFLIDRFKLLTTDVVVEGSKDSCPLKVVKFAKKLYDASIEKGNKYDLIYCVIDKDTHAHYNNALTLAQTFKKNNFTIINSVPCFEFWLLLHYTHTTKPFTMTLNKSICQSLISDELKKYLPNYVKNISTLDKNSLDYIFNPKTIKQAIKRSEIIINHCKTCNTDNPSTMIHEVVKELQTQQERKKKILNDDKTTSK